MVSVSPSIRRWGLHSDGLCRGADPALGVCRALAREKAVITQPEVNVYSSPSGKGTVKTQLHEGTRLRLVGKSVGEYQQFSLGDGTEGWIASSAIEPIIAPK